MRVTQKEIASRLGVSISLVSRVLSGTAEEIGIPKQTIEEVKKTAEAMGYVPNVAAQALKGKSSKFIGVVVYDFKDPFFVQLVANLQEKFHRLGYSIVLVGFTNRQLDEKDLSPLKQHILDAIIVIGSDLSGVFADQIKNTPIFRIGHSLQTETSISYCPDEKAFARDLANYLIPYNPKTISVFQSDLPNHNIRSNAIERALSSRNIKFQITKSSHKPYFEAGYQMTVDSIHAQSLPDVIVCTIDQIALGVLKALMEHNISVPKTVRVTGFDSIQMAQQYHPTLTTFRQPIDTIIDKIANRITNLNFTPAKELIKCPLVKGMSC